MKIRSCKRAIPALPLFQQTHLCQAARVDASLDLPFATALFGAVAGDGECEIRQLYDGDPSAGS